MTTPPTFAAGSILTAAQMNSVGLWLVKTQTIGTAVASVAVTNAFSADYENYKILISGGTSTITADLTLQLGAVTTNYYSAQIVASFTTGTVTGIAGGTSSFVAGFAGTGNLNMNVDLQSPFLSKTTQFSCLRPVLLTTGSSVVNTGFQNSTTSFTGFTIATTGGTLTGGTIYVYGYKGLV